MIRDIIKKLDLRKLTPETPEDAAARSQFPPERYEPVIRCSICTGEQTACMRERATGRLSEIMLLRSAADTAAFCRQYQVNADSIRKIY